MQLHFSKELLEAMPVEMCKRIGVDPEDISYHGMKISITRFTNETIAALYETLGAVQKAERGTGKKGLRGINSMRRDLKIWIDAAKDGAENIKLSTCKQFAQLAYETIQKLLPQRRFYCRDDDGIWQAYYVSHIDWQEARREKKPPRYYPAYATVTFCYRELGDIHSTSVHVEDVDVVGKTVMEVFRDPPDEYVPQNPELDAVYAERIAKYKSIYNEIGLQLLVSGKGRDSLDDMLLGERDRRHRLQVYSFVRDGKPSRAVVDVRVEKKADTDDGDEDDDKGMPSATYWRGRSYLGAKNDEEPDDIDEEDADPDGDQENGADATAARGDMTVPVPIHPTFCVFDLRRHMRLTASTDFVELYKYDKTLGEKLILPPAQRELVRMLLENKEGFNDIVAGKGGGSIICCAGLAGTGKTLTAEVYAEVMERPMYSVQCSQLGIEPPDLERKLLHVFARAQRWGAILLLDEADVYVAKRGTDLTQNAIVGVFLRVLEYYAGALFLTTNRGDLIDDAIASRCLARIDYTAPTIPDQQRIWKVLAAQANLNIPEDVIAEFSTKYPHTTGRDIKNLVKLTLLVTKARRCGVNLPLLEYVKKFKPTEDAEAAK